MGAALSVGALLAAYNPHIVCTGQFAHEILTPRARPCSAFNAIPTLGASPQNEPGSFSPNKHIEKHSADENYPSQRSFDHRRGDLLSRYAPIRLAPCGVTHSKRIAIPPLYTATQFHSSERGKEENPWNSALTGASLYAASKVRAARWRFKIASGPGTRLFSSSWARAARTAR